MSWFELLARCMFDNAERKKRCSSVSVLVHVDFFFFLFTIALWPARFVTNVQCTSSWTRVYCSKLSADREPEKMKCTDTSGDRYLWTLKKTAPVLSRRKTDVWSRRTWTARHWDFPNPRSLNTANGPGTSWTTTNHPSRALASSLDEQRPQTHDGYPSLRNFNHSIVETKPWSQASIWLP